MAPVTGPTIGIDLGTTHSSVGVWQNGKVEIIADSKGNRTTRSWVAFTDTERLIGDDAKDTLQNLKNTVFDAKRLIGRKFTDPEVQSDMKHWPFAVTSSSSSDTPIIQVEHKGRMRKFKAEEIIAMVLLKMREIAEDYLGEDVKNAVITVPAYFNDSQRQATKDAGAIAGLNVLRLINEPTAAAIAYGLNTTAEAKNVFVFDLGGGTCDVSLLTIEDGVFEVIATAGDTHLGGEDFDSCMVDYLAEEFQRRNYINIYDNDMALRRLRTAWERAKRDLSLFTAAHIEINSLSHNRGFSFTVTHTIFEERCNQYFRKCDNLIADVMHCAMIPKDRVDEIVLVGGSTRMPRIQSMITNFFNGKEPCKSINPDEAVVFGATVQAAILSGAHQSEKLSELFLMDITPLSLGIGSDGFMSNFIKRNRTVPTETTKTLSSTFVENQPGALIQVFEGEQVKTCDNNLLGKFDLDCDHTQIDICFSIDDNGILKVSAFEKSTGEKITITTDKGRLSQYEIEDMVNKFEYYKAEDDAKKNRVEAKTVLERYCYMIRASITKYSIPEDDKAALLDAANGAITWLDANKSAVREDIQERQNAVEGIADPIFLALYK